VLEACIDKRTGEIVVVKPEGSPWSDKERDGPVLVVVDLDDPDLQLDSTVKAYPYAIYEEHPKEPELGAEIGPKMIEMSRWKVERRGLVPGKSYRRADLKESLADYSGREVLRDR